jgi:iron complex outermembrane receptor protein
MRWRPPVVIAASLAVSSPVFGQARELAELSLEELGNLLVTSVSGRAEPLSAAAASIYVITRDDIARAGVTSLPEALRLAPNLLVARVDTGQYAISARGFNSAIANKLLVLIDGRTVYTPLFSGVFWDMQDVLLEDVERIEVVSGPGATLWGANAVNGVINVITRSTRDTQGSLAVAGAGNQERGAAFRHGGVTGGNVSYRVYAKVSELENTERADGIPIRDAWERAQIGARADAELTNGLLTLQGDVYDGQSEDRGGTPPFTLGRIEIAGANVLARWTRRLASGSELRVRTYVDHTERSDSFLFAPEADIFDIEVRHDASFGSHDVLWGGGYRRASDDVANGFLFGFVPPQKDLEWGNLFAQTELELGEAVGLTLGIKLESNDYTGTESLPSARIAWTASPTQLVWAGLSRAVRAPSRLDRDVILPPPSGFVIRGGPYFVSEVAEVVEIGYRAELGGNFTLSTTAFHYDWDKLRSGQPAPAFIENMIEGEIYGIGGWATWKAGERWRMSGGFTTLEHDLGLKPGSTDPVGPRALGNDPEYQLLLRSSHDFGARQQLDVMFRRVDDLPSPVVPAYSAVDAHYSFRLGDDITLSLAVQNLFDDSHPESGAAPGRSVFPRAGYLEFRWSPAR